ncbi:MAG: MBL fold metallo-hydrolase [Candidatus Woesearchaeota archaeon]|jgi:phosphoribosyl 1,2-cyclic phosphodiesterase
MTDMVVNYWGVRGSIPTPLTAEELLRNQLELIERLRKDGIPEPAYVQQYLDTISSEITRTFGGDTPCIEIQIPDSPLIIIDAGTGIRRLGLDIKDIRGNRYNPMSNIGNTEVHILLTHFHWDHVQGFPFFNPAYDSNTILHVHGRRVQGESIESILNKQQQAPLFPVPLSKMTSSRSFHSHDLPIIPFGIGNAHVEYRFLEHPQEVLAYAISYNGKKMVCATDTEHKNVPDPRFVSLAKNADILIYDSQYTPEDYPLKKGWGHSTYEEGIKIALAANTKCLVLFHLEPTYDDRKLAQMERDAQEYARQQLKLPENIGKELQVVVAYQGMVQKI